MRRWHVIIEGEASAKRFLPTIVADAENENEAKRLACAEFDQDGDRFIELAEVTSEDTDAMSAGVVSVSGRIFFG